MCYPTTITYNCAKCKSYIATKEKVLPCKKKLRDPEWEDACHLEEEPLNFVIEWSEDKCQKCVELAKDDEEWMVV
ncbi:hypothetical protein QQX98_001989 [Neonectria punicea]|uniref:Uncharacterized protein n=1 Tax=Neonectria punicea TaxID=979145 RepID=A0ABR1HLL7_9HYPO